MFVSLLREEFALDLQDSAPGLVIERGSGVYKCIESDQRSDTIGCNPATHRAESALYEMGEIVFKQY